jgi:ribosomal protein L7/L12
LAADQEFNPTLSNIAKTVKHVTGLGLVKGSQEAKDYTKKLREMKAKATGCH